MILFGYVLNFLFYVLEIVIILRVFGVGDKLRSIIRYYINRILLIIKIFYFDNIY